MENNLKKEDSFFFMAFHKVLKMNDLTDFQKVLFMEILYICEYGNHKKCIIPNSTFSKYFNRTQITVSKNISELCSKGLILKNYNALQYRQIKINRDFIYRNDLNDKSGIEEIKDINTYNNELSPEYNDDMKFDNQNDELNDEQNVIGNIEKKNDVEKNSSFFLHNLSDFIFKTWNNGNLSQICEYIQSHLTNNQIVNELTHRDDLLKSEMGLSEYFYELIENALDSGKIYRNKKTQFSQSSLEDMYNSFFKKLVQVRQDGFDKRCQNIIENLASINNTMCNDKEYIVRGYLIEKTEKQDKSNPKAVWCELILEDIIGNNLKVNITNKIYINKIAILEKAAKGKRYIEMKGRFKAVGSKKYCLTYVSEVRSEIN
jgi:hypothetical protein